MASESAMCERQKFSRERSLPEMSHTVIDVLWVLWRVKVCLLKASVGSGEKIEGGRFGMLGNS